jgi:DNA-binding Lrp family transcriptional regulator
MDEIDFKILRILSKNSRETYRNLVKMIKAQDGIDLTENTLRKKIQSMVESGIIDKFSIIVNPALFGCGVAISIFDGKGKSVDPIIEKLRKNKRIMFLVDTIGSFVAVVFLFKSRDDFSTQQRKLSSEMAPAKLSSTFIYESKPAIDVHLSDQDWGILNVLKDDARKDIGEIAKDVGTSASYVERRICDLVGRKILKFTISVNPFKVSELIPYYVYITFDGGLGGSEIEELYTRLYAMLDKCWLRQKVMEPKGLVMELYADTLQEVNKNIQSIQNMKEVNDVTFFFPSKFHEFDGWVECIAAEAMKMMRKRPA